MKERTIMVFETSVDGHHLEYLHHLYEMAVNTNDKYVFCVPSGYEERKKAFVWKECRNVQFDYLKPYDYSNTGLIKKGFLKSKELLRCFKKYHPTSILLITLAEFFPFLPFLFIGKNVQVSGIVYTIYLYAWKKSGWKRKAAEAVMQFLLCKARSIHSIFILNDEVAVRYLNRKWRTKKYVCLPDPYVNISGHGDRTIASTYPGRDVVLHFGGLTERKGTMEIMRAVDRLSHKNLERYVFVFAGIISQDIRDSFYSIYGKLKEKGAVVLVYDEFCTYEFLADCCEQSDLVLAPYTNTFSSSGILSYCAQFGKCIAVPDDGLLGKLVRRNKLGVTIGKGQEDDIYELLSSPILPEVNHNDGLVYIGNNTVQKFQAIIKTRLYE